ncbi:hypothetical protein [Paenibacillus gorillae]|uniref:hypothetical protein n=1 Tax=Paenibacillus gorillae TaxID=1243662 RepID=UPI0004B3D064|nr:hypothetical protein [Paenibacillus gorillae]
MNKLLKRLIVVTTTIVLLLSVMPSASVRAEQQKKPAIVTDYEIQLIGEKSTWNAYPLVRIGKTNYGDRYTRKSDEYAFPDLKFKMPSIAGQNSSGSYKNDGNKFIWSAWVIEQYYQNGDHLYIHISYPAGDKQHNQLFDFNSKNNTMRLVKKTISASQSYTMEVYPQSDLFSVRTKRLLNSLDIYHIKTGKLIATADYAFQPYPLVKGSFGHTFNRKPASNSLIINLDVNKTGKDKTGKSFTYSGNDLYELLPDGSKKQIEYSQVNYWDATTGWTNKIGNVVYGSYYDKQSKTWLIGYKTGSSSSYKPLTQTGTESRVDFSPNLKYIIITEYKKDAKTGKRTNEYRSIIVDGQTGKVLRTLGAYNRKYVYFIYNWKYGDELVELNFNNYARDGYLNLSTGIFVSKYSEWTYSYGSYSGDFSELLSPERSPEILVNDTLHVNLSAPGVFLAGNYLWYLSVSDFALEIGASVSVADKKVIVKLDNKQFTVDPKTMITFRNRIYIPMQDFRKLGLKLQLNGEEHVKRFIYDAA